MRVFVIPAWHPIPGRPNSANWILPHIDAIRSAGSEAYVLQADFDNGTGDTGEPKLLSPNHLYSALVAPRHRLARTRWFYQVFLSRYRTAVEMLFQRAIARWGQPDLLHAHVSMPSGWAAARLGRQRGIPVVVTEHYSGFFSDIRFPWRLGSLISEMAKTIQGFYTVSETFAAKINATGIVRVDDVMPNPIDLDIFAPKCSKDRRAHFRIVTAGGLSRRKGTDILFEALCLVDPRIEWELMIFGKCNRRSEYAYWLERKPFPSRVKLMGEVPQRELAAAFRTADCYVVASRIETANVSMLQAIACGTPVIAARCGGPESLITSEVGILVPTESPRAIADAVEAIYAAPLDCYRPETLQRYVAERYSIAVLGKRLASAYSHAARQYRDECQNAV